MHPEKLEPKFEIRKSGGELRAIFVRLGVILSEIENLKMHSTQLLQTQMRNEAIKNIESATIKVYYTKRKSGEAGAALLMKDFSAFWESEN